MAEHVQRHVSLTDVAERTEGALSVMKGLVKFFNDEALSVADLKALTITEILMVAIYAR